MCGIAGILGEFSSEDKLDAMLQTQQHRGPDFTGMWSCENVQLGHNRLSIIDLSTEANQPFTDEANRYKLVFNGEIYNYLELKNELKSVYNFTTNSDTEVLLASYIHFGKACLHKLNGMFSFVIYDTKNKSLFGARDRFGVKPFYYATQDDSLIFTSEIKAIHASGIQKEPNKKVWANYFSYGSYGLPNETFFENIHQLPAGHYLDFSEEKLTITQWYNFEEAIQKQPQKLSFEDAKKHYVELLKDSIQLRFRADVKVGFNVSGGVDSSTLLSFVNEYNSNEKIQAFTFYTNDERYDELPWVEEMIAVTNNPLAKVLLTADEVPSLAEKISQIQDEPFGGIPTLAYANIFKSARETGVTVLLDGQGMDEQWAGYDYYTKDTNTTIQGVKKSPFRQQVLSEELQELASKIEYPKLFDDQILNTQYRDLFYTKIPRALRFNDRVSMAFSTELREPFLDYRLVEFAFAQPLNFKIKDGVKKYMLRTIVSDYLSDNISYAPKRPLQTPQREWLVDDLQEFVSNKIEAIKQSEYKDWFNFAEMDAEWNAYKNGDNSSSFHIWQWINFAMLLC